MVILGVPWAVKWISRETNCVTYTFQVAGKTYLGTVMVPRLDAATIRATVQARIREHLDLMFKVPIGGTRATPGTTR